MLVDATPPDDGMVMRRAGPWVRDKLSFVELYSPALGHVVKRQWERWYFIDGLAGPGVNYIPQEGDARVWGSPLIALQADPPFHRCLMLELDRSNYEALAKRTWDFRPRAHVEQGDVNTDLLPMMSTEIIGRERRHPMLVVLDPQGLEVHWDTVEAIARFRTYSLRAEMLILFPSVGLARAAGAYPQQPASERTLNLFWGDDEWKQLLGIPSAKAPIAALDLYLQKLQGLGYNHAFSSAVKKNGNRGPVMYWMVFATDSATGARIMRSCFDHRNQPHLPGIDPPIVYG
jgi:three-Cys-motif partner protein